MLWRALDYSRPGSVAPCQNPPVPPLKKARVGPHDERVNIQKHSFKSGDIAGFQVNIDDSIINMSDLPETVRKIHQSCRDGFGICLYLRKKAV